MYFNKVLKWLFSVAFHHFTTVCDVFALYVHHSVLKSLVFLFFFNFLSTILRFLQTEHNKECCVQMQEWRKLWNGHVHAQEMPRVSAEKVQGDGHAGWMWVLPADRRLVDQYDGEQRNCRHVFFFPAVHIHTLRTRQCWALILHSDEACWIFLGD